MKYTSVNPFNNKVLATYGLSDYPDMDKLNVANEIWRKLPLKERLMHLQKVAVLLEHRKDEYAKLITLEMGKPFTEAEYEIAKTITAFDYYIENSERFLTPEYVVTRASESYIMFEPLGIVLSIMPWNFPFWQVFRFAIPTLVAGNTTILKHAPNVPQCAMAIEKLFIDAGVPKGVFTNYFLSNEDTARLIEAKEVRGISFTGSDTTGSYLASLAGRGIKKSVMELGGNDAFIVLPDVNMDIAVSGAIKSRSINCGQSCNGAKRFLVHKDIAREFIQKLSEQVSKLKIGDPSDVETQLGPLARFDLAEKVKRQIATTIEQGASPLYGQMPPSGEGYFVQPVVLTGVLPGMCAFEEEIFGPVWSVTIVDTFEQAVLMANATKYGLGASIWTSNVALAKQAVSQIEAGNVFINDIVKSDPRLPFGGIKNSGFGRELSSYGLKEFVNIKTVYVH